MRLASLTLVVSSELAVSESELAESELAKRIRILLCGDNKKETMSLLFLDWFVNGWACRGTCQFNNHVDNI